MSRKCQGRAKANREEKEKKKINKEEIRNDVSNDELKVITLNAGGRVVNCFPPLRRDLRTCKSYIVSYTNIEKQRSGKYNFPMGFDRLVRCYKATTHRVFFTGSTRLYEPSKRIEVDTRVIITSDIVAPLVVLKRPSSQMTQSSFDKKHGVCKNINMDVNKARFHERHIEE
ncbi:hypothetical protein V1477_006980 [Vespula maculifrons]|uniref:Uncharacterized protein n=1 Tax=Vespula maculifrons TaxID=7453 RepID=A0ABD2CJS5_VESMC